MWCAAGGGNRQRARSDDVAAHGIHQHRNIERQIRHQSKDIRKD